MSGEYTIYTLRFEDGAEYSCAVRAYLEPHTAAIQPFSS